MNSRDASDQVLIENVRLVKEMNNRWCGTVRMRDDEQPRHVLIFRRGSEYSAIPATCPHEGFRLDTCPVDGNGQIVCPAHGEAVRVEGNPGALPVVRNGESFAIKVDNRAPDAFMAAEEVQRLRDEVEALREANGALEAQIVAVSEQMEAMVGELSEKSRAVEKFATEQQRMSTFITRVMDTMDNLVVLLDRNGRIQRVNPVVEVLLGYAPSELVGRSPDQLLGQSDLDALRGGQAMSSAAVGTVLFRNVLSRGHVAMEVSLLGRKTDRPSLLLHGAPLYDMAGKLEGVVIVGSDVTTLRSREKALKESEERFRDYSDIGSDWLWETDEQLRFKDVSHWQDAVDDPLRAEMARNYKLVVGRRTEELAHPDDLLDTEKWARHKATRERQLEYRDFEFCSLPPGGSPTWLSTSGKPLFGPEGEFRGYRGIAKDITARKEIEAELRRHRDHLSELVAEQTADLIHARDAAEQASRMKSEFLANISHELRTPLHGVLSFAGIGMQRAGTAPPEKIRDYFDRIRQSGQRLTSLVDDLLDLARLEAGRSTMSFVSVDMVALERQVRFGAEGLINAKHLHVVVEAHTADTTVAADAQRISQVLLNLLSNAIKFSPPRSTLTWVLADDRIEREGGRVSVPALRITLEDEGVGIPEAELDSIFDKFVQSTKTKSGAGGTGLGLAICREIIGAHGGRISARNTSRGAAFDVVLPRFEADCG